MGRLARDQPYQAIYYKLFTCFLLKILHAYVASRGLPVIEYNFLMRDNFIYLKYVVSNYLNELLN